MSYGPGGKVYINTLVSAATSTPAIDLAHSWDRVFLEMPTFASGGTHYVQAQATSDGTFRRVYTIDPIAGDHNVVEIQPGLSQVMLPIPSGFQYYKVENTSGVANGATYRFHVS